MAFFECNDTHQNDAMTIDPATQEEINRLDQAVDDFASEMKARLREQAIKGYRGWDDPENYQRIDDRRVVRHAVRISGRVGWLAFRRQHGANGLLVFWEISADDGKLKGAQDARVALSLEKKRDGLLNQHVRRDPFARELLIVGGA